MATEKLWNHKLLRLIDKTGALANAQLVGQQISMLRHASNPCEQGQKLLLYARGLISCYDSDDNTPAWLSYMFSRVCRCLIPVFRNNAKWLDELYYAPVEQVSVSINPRLVYSLCAEIEAEIKDEGARTAARSLSLYDAYLFGTESDVRSAAFCGDIGVKFSMQDQERLALLKRLRRRLKNQYRQLGACNEQARKGK